MIKITKGQIVSSLISLFFLYVIMEPISIAHSETRIEKISNMLSAMMVWGVMIGYMATDFNIRLYKNIISKLIK